MSDVDRLFDQYLEAHRGSGEADPREYLQQLEGTDQRELAALIDGFLATAPRREWNPAAYEASPSKRLVESIASDWEEAAEPVGWRELLPQLRTAAKVKRADLVARLADAIGAGNQAEKVGGYYHQMETGQLPSEGVSNDVLKALGDIVGETAERIRAAGSVIGAGGDQSDVRAQVVLARKAVQNPEYADTMADMAMPAPAEAAADQAEDEDDLVDRLFTGGPDAEG
jgi:hypothetical protein